MYSCNLKLWNCHFCSFDKKNSSAFLFVYKRMDCYSFYIEVYNYIRSHVHIHVFIFHQDNLANTEFTGIFHLVP